MGVSSCAFGFVLVVLRFSIDVSPNRKEYNASRYVGQDKYCIASSMP
jgi:hypothetical protein